MAPGGGCIFTSIDSPFEAIAWYGARIEHGRELFLGVLGHYLRAPLQASIASAELLLRDKSLEAASLKAARRILDSGNRVARMLVDLFDFSKRSTILTLAAR